MTLLQLKKLSGEDEIEIVGDQIHMNVSEPGEYIINLKDGGSAGASADELGGELGGELELDGSEEFDSVSDSELVVKKMLRMMLIMKSKWVMKKKVKAKNLKKVKAKNLKKNLLKKKRKNWKIEM
jgi:hypothetical protein